ncbi:MAG: hypothetical protein AAFR57_07525 [Pseudomonadota bacterium]
MYKGITALVALLASGCSPYLYTSEIDAFATATGNLSTGLTQAQQAIRTNPDTHAFWASYADTDKPVRFSEAGCDTASKTTCYVFVGSTAYNAPAEDAQLVAEIQKLKSLNGYAAGLQAISNAEDREAFDAARATLATNASTLAGAASGNPAVTPVAEVAVRAGTTILGYFLDQARFDQLRASVLATDKYIAAMGPDLAKALGEIRKHQLLAVKTRMRTVQGALGSGKLRVTEHERLLTQLQSDVRAVAALQRTRSDKLATELVEAHSALAEALRQRRIDPVAVITAINEFATTASDFKTAFSKI